MDLKRVISESAMPERQKQLATAVLPYVQIFRAKIRGILNHYNIGTVHKLHKKIGPMISKTTRTKALGIYSVPCECGKAYIGETGRAMKTRLDEHSCCIRLRHPSKSAVAEHSINENHQIKFEDVKILARYWDRLTKEAIEIRLNPNNMNRDEGYTLSKAWKYGESLNRQ
ncbi:hypothetical protein J437_LFUL014564 [Ladona fulva]|uniref:GIY-YIG domain-containing protein n=1 Tax=Ladona fulva TaxID=123851 RepID=A0A8K0KH18_LADFU|nr:hypothetical protein J437_LFUL014564 [Ladona fulva]